MIIEGAEWGGNRGGMSVMPLLYTRKRRGPRIEPCGTPEETSKEGEVEPLTTTDWDRLRR